MGAVQVLQYSTASHVAGGRADRALEGLEGAVQVLQYNSHLASQYLVGVVLQEAGGPQPRRHQELMLYQQRPVPWSPSLLQLHSPDTVMSPPWN
jgi:hypothetical protein